MVEVLHIEPELEKQKLIRRLGGRKSAQVSRAVGRKIKRLSSQLNSLMKPRLYYQTRRISAIEDGVLRLEGGYTFRSPRLTRALRGCKEVVIFIATIGGAIDKEIKRLMEKNRSSTAYILDAMGSVAVESMVESFHQQMGAKCQKAGMDVTLRFSPGYCDWPIQSQKKLFSLFNPAGLDVQLTGSCFMQPQKSVSGIFGKQPVEADLVDPAYNPCLECPRQNCAARRN